VRGTAGVARPAHLEEPRRPARPHPRGARRRRGVSVRPAVGPGHRDCDLACLFRWSVERDGTHCGTRAGRGEARLLGRPRARGGLRGAVATALRPARRACVGGGRGAQRRRAGP
ncbi:unnamed protein product, partial [Prorocentrum cordatum]